MAKGYLPAHQVEGDGPVVIFVTGLSGLGSYWARQVQALSRSRSCVTFDQPGIGATPETPRPWSTRGWADDVLALADRIGAARFVLVGHSTGGAIAQHVAALAPDRVASLVLSGTWVHGDERFRRIFALRRDILQRLGQAPYQELGTILTRPLDWQEPCEVSRGKPVGGTVPMDVVLDRIDALVEHDGRKACRKIFCPTMICGAEDDLLVPPNHARDLADRIRSSRVELIPAGGHHFPQTRADWFNARLMDFLGAGS